MRLRFDWWMVVIVHTNRETTDAANNHPRSDWWVVVIVHTNHKTTDAARI